MKKLLFFFALILFFLPAQAQKGDDCPAVDWVKTTTTDTDKYSFARIVPTRNGGRIVTGTYYSGCQSIAGKNVPNIKGTHAAHLGNFFIMKIDSSNKAEWILPFQLVKSYNKPFITDDIFNEFLVDDEENVHLLFVFKGVEVEFMGKHYGSATTGWDINGKKYYYYFKIGPTGTLLSESSILTADINDASINYEVSLLKAITNDSSLILNIRPLASDDTITLFNGAKLSSSLLHNHIIKVNTQFQIQWAKSISNSILTVVDGENSDELFVTGYIRKIPNSAKYNTTVNVDGYLLMTDSNIGGVFITKLNLKNGNFSNTRLLLEGCEEITKSSKSVGQEPLISETSYNLIPELATKDSNSIYLVGTVNNSLLINSRSLINLTSSQKAAFLLKYNLINQQYAVNILGVHDNGILVPYKVHYLPKSKQIIVSGIFKASNNNTILKFKNDTVKSTLKRDIFALSLNPELVVNSDYSEWVKELDFNWLIYSRVKSDSSQSWASFWNLFVDKKEDIHLSGCFYDNVSWDWKNITTNVNDKKASGCFETKLTALSNRISHRVPGLWAAQKNAQYQWYDCQNGMSPIQGETKNYFIPANRSLKYALKVSNSWCSVMSDCQLDVSSVKDLRSVQIYPNPVSHTLYLANLPIGVDIAVFDVMGRKIFSSSVQQSSFKINTESWAQGVYLVQLNYQGERRMEKVVK